MQHTKLLAGSGFRVTLQLMRKRERFSERTRFLLPPPKVDHFARKHVSQLLASVREYDDQRARKFVTEFRRKARLRSSALSRNIRSTQLSPTCLNWHGLLPMESNISCRRQRLALRWAQALVRLHKYPELEDCVDLSSSRFWRGSRSCTIWRCGRFQVGHFGVKLDDDQPI
jgi:hypothetical protein